MSWRSVILLFGSPHGFRTRKRTGIFEGPNCFHFDYLPICRHDALTRFSSFACDIRVLAVGVGGGKSNMVLDLPIQRQMVLSNVKANYVNLTTCFSDDSDSIQLGFICHFDKAKEIQLSDHPELTNNSPGGSPRLALNVLNSVAIGIYCMNLEGQCTYCNLRCLDLLGFQDASELLNKNIHRLIHYKQRDGSEYPVDECKVLDALSSGQGVHCDQEVYWRKDGSRFDAEYWSYLLEENGAMVGAVVSFVDISLRREENAYRNQLARLVESSYDAILSKDLDGIITSWNRGATEIYGFDLEEAIGQPISIILPENQTTEEPEITDAVRKGVQLEQFGVKRRRKNGQVCDISLTVSPIFNADGQLIGSSSIERDVTQQRLSQDDILRAKNAAEHAESLANAANRSRAEFLANISHELRTPMNAILGMLQLALDEPMDPTLSDYLKTAKMSADSLLELVNEILDFSKIESGKFEIVNLPFNLRATINAAAKALSPLASEKGLELFCEIDSNVPTSLIGDRRRIKQIVNNLLSNAVKFTQTGEVVIKVAQVRRLPQEVRLRFAASDTGIGIAAEDRERIFSPFAQADMSSTREHHGTGLGLSICSALISLMGGQLQLDSEIGKGSTFSFELSLPVDEESQPTDRFPPELVGDLKVLIVDDNPTNLRILEKIFVGWSMQPIVAESAMQAMRILDEMTDQNDKIAIALVDGQMPGTDGFELAEMIAQKHAAGNPPVVIMQSPADLATYAEKKHSAPVANYLNKPISHSELLDTVVETLDLFTYHPHKEQRKIPRRQQSKPLNILLVEDLPANQKVAKAILEKRGHRVVAVSNGRLAADRVQSGDDNFDVILMDIQMPVMDGFQATAAIRALPDPDVSRTPIIAMTAHAMQGDREACLAAGMDAYVAKPLDAKRLIEISEAIALRPEFLNDSVRVAATRKKNKASRDAEFGKQFELVNLESSVNRLGGDQELFKEFVIIFREDAPQLLQRMVTAIEESRPKDLEKSAHALKGLISNFGASPCVELAQRLENAGKQNDIASIQQELPRFKNLYQQLWTELAGFVQ